MTQVSDRPIDLSRHVVKKLKDFYASWTWRLAVDLPAAVPSDLNLQDKSEQDEAKAAAVASLSCWSSSSSWSRAEQKQLRGARALPVASEVAPGATAATKPNQRRDKQLERQRREEELDALGQGHDNQPPVEDDLML